MFSRKKDKVLEVRLRKKIYDFVNRHPGCHYRELERRTGLAHGTLTHHLHALVKHELIITLKEHNLLLYFPRETPVEDVRLLTLLRQQSLRRILLYLALHGRATHEELRTFTVLSPSTVSWHLARFARERVIRVDKDNARSSYVLLLDRQRVVRSFIRYKESLFDSLVNKMIDMWEIP